MSTDLSPSVKHITSVIQEIYLSDDIPWIIGYSGGKDSTACVQLIWHAIEQLPQEKRKKPIYVISTDTLVENPVIAAWVTLSLQKMEVAALQQNLPFHPQRLTPRLEDRFWVNLIGKGYPAPRPKFRWCTDRLKIQTSTKFIQNLSETNGEAILVIGSRKAESVSRAKVLAKYEESSRNYLSKNSNPHLSRVWVYTPIVDWSNDDVWEYLAIYENPWGVSCDELISLYRGATPDNECPVVTDTGTQSCGDSRFGCFVCTMVSQDKSMQAMILNDESKAWMQPILDYRNNHLAPTEKERSLREFRRMRAGQLILMGDQLVHGPYTQEHRASLLKHLLLTQKKVQQEGASQGFSNVSLISREELEEIRRIWIEEKGEIEDLLPQIYEEALGEKYSDHIAPVSPLENTDLQLLKDVCANWINENHPCPDTSQSEQRISELYKLTRNLIAETVKSNKQKRRSKHLDQIEKIYDQFSFLDEEEALLFAKTHLRKTETDAAGADDITSYIQSETDKEATGTEEDQTQKPLF